MRRNGRTCGGRAALADTVFLIRGQGLDHVARATATALRQAGAHVVAVMDERAGPVDTAPFDRIGLDAETPGRLGLAGLPENWGWFCGDLCLYAARAELPGFAHYCLIESDVALAGDAARRLVAGLEAEPADLLAARLGPAAPAPKFSRGLAALSLDPGWGCLFPVTRVSAPALDAMFELRRRSLAAGVAAEINDEGILAGIAQGGRFVDRALEDSLPDLFDPAGFDTNPPHLAEAVARGDHGDRILHPVLPLDLVLARIARGEKAYGHHRLRRVLARALPEERALLEAALRAASPARPAAAGKPVPRGRAAHQRMTHLAGALQLAAPIRVLDIRANPLIEGDAPYLRLLRAGLAEVYGFEPQPEALAALEARKSDRETYFPHAVGDGAAGVLHVYRAQGLTSLYELDPDSVALCGFASGAGETGRIEVATRRLDDLDEVPEIDFLKIDVQGAETRIIAHGRRKLSRALAVMTEMRLFPIYRDEPRYGDLERELTGQGFEFLRFATLKHVALSRRFRKALHRSEKAQAVDGDAIFLRDLRRIESFDDDALVRLAIIADGILDNADLTLRVLELLEDRGRIGGRTIRGYLRLLPAERLRPDA